MRHLIQKIVRRQRRKANIRHSVLGTTDRPRLTVFRSHTNIYAQIIDDTAGKTLVAASSRDKALRGTLPASGNKQAAVTVGTHLAKQAIAAGIQQVVFDRNGYAYHGRVRELADAARKGGLKF